MICHEKHTANIKVKKKKKKKISEHGAFPLVSVRVQHEEPGNMHPYNFEPIFFFLWPKLLWTNYCKKPQNHRFQDHPTRIFNVLDDFGMNKGQCPVQKTFGILIVLTQRSIHQPVWVRVRIPVPTPVMNKA